MSWKLHWARAGRKAGFDFVAPSGEALVRGRGARIAPRPPARAAAGVPCARGPGGETRSSPGGSPTRPRDASRRDVQVVLFDLLVGCTLSGAVCAGPGSRTIGVAIDRRCPLGVRVLEGKGMPCVPEEQPMAWFTREGLRSAEDFWAEAARIVHLLECEGVPLSAEASAVGPSCPRPRQRLSCPGLLLHAREALLQRGAAGMKTRRVVKRVVPVVPVADDG